MRRPGYAGAFIWILLSALEATFVMASGTGECLRSFGPYPAANQITLPGGLAGIWVQTPAPSEHATGRLRAICMRNEGKIPVMMSYSYYPDEKRWNSFGGGVLFSVSGTVFVQELNDGSQLGCGVLWRLNQVGESVVLTPVLSSSILGALQAAHLPYAQDTYGLSLDPNILVEAVRRLPPQGDTKESSVFEKTYVRGESDELRRLDCSNQP